MKEKFIISTLILMIGGFLTKILGMIIKIVMTRYIGIEGTGLYMMILPTFSLFIGLAQAGFPIALSKLIAEDNRNNKKLFFSLIPLALVINIFLMLIIIIIAPYLANNLLHDKRCLLGIYAIALVIPFTTLSSLCRSYFFGKQKMLPHVLSNITEDIFRLILIIVGVPFFLNKGLKYAVCYVVLINVLSELISILILFFFLPKNVKIKRCDLSPSKIYIKDSLDISIPNTTSRLIGSIGYFLEPIILTSSLLYVGYSNQYIVTEYGIISGYVLPILLLPSFFTLAISQALLPTITKLYYRNKITEVKRKIKQAIFFSLLIGIPATICFVLFPNFFLKLIYNTTEGTKYMLFLAPICLLQYIQAPLSFSLDAIGKSKDNMKATLYGTIIRIVFLFILSLSKIGIWSLIFSTSLNVCVVTLYNIKKIKSYI
ncbi:MAG: oligosaccharide flippase family protein [Bacilli bacterium]|nr:oligosaccharide flippase family protein [Bacilli bacterium]